MMPAVAITVGSTQLERTLIYNSPKTVDFDSIAKN